MTNLSWNGYLAPNGGSAEFGFDGWWSGSNTAPTSFGVNGSTCATS